MFSNLSKGSVLYGLDTKDGIKVFNATVKQYQYQDPDLCRIPLANFQRWYWT